MKVEKTNLESLELDSFDHGKKTTAILSLWRQVGEPGTLCKLGYSCLSKAGAFLPNDVALLSSPADG